MGLPKQMARKIKTPVIARTTITVDDSRTVLRPAPDGCLVENS